MNLIADTIIIKRWYAALARIDVGTLHFVTPTAERVTFRGTQVGIEAEFAISEWGVIRRMAARGDIAMGEDYIAGLWETPDIEALFVFFLQNFDVFGDFADGNMVQRSLHALHNRLVRRNSRAGSLRNIQDHYDVGNDFYALWLDQTMTYSSAMATSESGTLEDAQRRKYQRLIDGLGMDGADILEIGCGWGGFAEQASGQSHRVTGLTISPSQYEFSRRRLGNAADIRLQDYRDIEGRFDGIVSIEMFEAVGEQYWPSYFRQIRERLKPGGTAMVQTITIRDDLFDRYRRCSDFIRHYVFPGGMLPSLYRFREEAEKAGLAMRDSFAFGQDYAQTLRLWDQRLHQVRSDVIALGYRREFLRNWHYYLNMCAAAFAVKRTDVMQVQLTHA